MKSKCELKFQKCTLVLCTRTKTGFDRKFWNTPVSRSQGQTRLLQRDIQGRKTLLSHSGMATQQKL